MPGFELIGTEEFEEIQDIFNNGGILFRYGFDKLRNNCYKVKNFEDEFSRKFNSRYALAVTSGTAALRVALASIGIQPNDEVITQCFTFVATVEAIIESKAVPVCAEIDKTLNMDPDDLLNKITNKTKAVIVVHMLGSPAKINKIKEICDEMGIILIEDTAWGCGGKFNNKYLGTIGDIGTFSFDFAKTMTTGEGGMILTNNKDFYKKAAAWHDHGHENNPSVPRWEDTRTSSGFNFRMTELQGAVGLAQLKKLDFIVQKHRENRDKLVNLFSKFSKIEFREVPNGSFDTADALIFFVDSPSTAKRCRELLLQEGLTTKILPEAYTWHFAGTWMHMPELRIKHPNLEYEFPKSREILLRSVSIPINVNMSDEIIEKYYLALKDLLE